MGLTSVIRRLPVLTTDITLFLEAVVISTKVVCSLREDVGVRVSLPLET